MKDIVEQLIAELQQLIIREQQVLETLKKELRKNPLLANAKPISAQEAQQLQHKQLEPGEPLGPVVVSNSFSSTVEQVAQLWRIAELP